MKGAVRAAGGVEQRVFSSGCAAYGVARAALIDADHPRRLVAGGARARRRPGWRPRHSGLDEMIAGVWRWLQTGPAAAERRPKTV